MTTHDLGIKGSLASKICMNTGNIWT